MPPREIPRHSGTAKYIFHLNLGGGDRHAIAIAAWAWMLTKEGFRVDRMDNYLTKFEGAEVPDLVFSRTDRMRAGPRSWNATVRYRGEVVDTHDPVPDWKPGKDGFDDCVKLQLARGDEYCASSHGARLENPSEELARVETAAAAGDDIMPHSLCIEGLLWLCRRAIP